jgi:hypothetical protein
VTDLLAAMTAIDPADRPGAAEVAARLRGLAGATAGHWVEVKQGEDTAPIGIVADQPQQVPRDVSSEQRPTAVKRRPVTQPVFVIGALALAMIAALVTVLIISGNRSQSDKPKPPAYPSVPGRLGDDLRDLQRSVQQ